MDIAKTDPSDGTDRAPRPISVATLVTGTVALAAMIRGMSAVMTQFLVWPLTGALPTALYPSVGFLVAVSMDLLLTVVFIGLGLLVGLKARKHSELWWRGIQRTGWVLMIDVGIYLVSVLIAITVFASGATTPGFWLLVVYIIAGNAVLLWLGLRIARTGKSLCPPPPEED